MKKAIIFAVFIFSKLTFAGIVQNKSVPTSKSTSSGQMQCSLVFSSKNETADFLKINVDKQLANAAGATPRRAYVQWSEPVVRQFEAVASKYNLSNEAALDLTKKFITIAKKYEILDFANLSVMTEQKLSIVFDSILKLDAFSKSEEQVSYLLGQISDFQRFNINVVSSEKMDQNGRLGGVVSVAIISTIKFPSLSQSISLLAHNKKVNADTDLDSVMQIKSNGLDTQSGQFQKKFTLKTSSNN